MRQELLPGKHGAERCKRDIVNRKLFKITFKRAPRLSISLPSPLPSPPKQKGKKHMAAEQDQLVNSLFRDDAKRFFVDNCDEIFEKWTSLLRQTEFPDNASFSDERLRNALLALHHSLTQAETIHMALLASAQFARTIDRLKGRIRTERRTGTTVRKRGHRDATVIIDIYMRATGVAKEQVHQLIRVANRCAALSKDVPLLLLVLTNDVAKVMLVNLTPSRLRIPLNLI